MSGALLATFPGLTVGGQTQCSPVTFDPPDGSESPGTVMLNTTTLGAHIFYTLHNDTGVPPTHTGDNATGITVRMGSNSGTVNGVGSINHEAIIEALAYKAGLLDSVITTASYPPPGGPGGGG